MEKYEISKEQVLELAKDTEKIKIMFPEAFKKELEVGKVYKRPHNSAIFYVEEKKCDNWFKVYGFDSEGNWMPEDSQTYPNNDVEATPEEWKSAMTKELIKRYGEDWRSVKLKECLLYGKKVNLNEYFSYISETEILNNNGIIFKYGIWAEVLDEQYELKLSIEKMRAELLMMEKRLK